LSGQEIDAQCSGAADFFAEMEMSKTVKVIIYNFSCKYVSRSLRKSNFDRIFFRSRGRGRC